MLEEFACAATDVTFHVCFFFKDSHIRGIKDQKVRCSIFSLLALLANISTQPNQYQKVSIKLPKNFP